jgi:PHD/YefM family antitoxin component YafN of YafNO toxin-antitoxin module
MKTLIEQQLSRDFIDALDELNETPEYSLLIHIHGQEFVVLKAEDYQSWQETAYLLSSSKNAECLHSALAEPLDNCKDLTDVLKDLDS